MGRGALAVGIVYQTFETYERRGSEPEDAQAESELESRRGGGRQGDDFVAQTWSGQIWKESNPQ